MHLEHQLNTQLILPGTHGLLCAWSPPAIGVNISVLLDLEKDLWIELQKTLSKNVLLQSSRSWKCHRTSPATKLIIPSHILDIIRMRNMD